MDVGPFAGVVWLWSCAVRVGAEVGNCRVADDMPASEGSDSVVEKEALG